MGERCGSEDTSASPVSSLAIWWARWFVLRGSFFFGTIMAHYVMLEPLCRALILDAKSK